MFGYIRPLQGELKVRELERFKAGYCGLCHALGKKYGFASRFILSYELVFLAMLLWGDDEPVEIKRRRCIASPLRTRRYCKSNGALDACAGYSVILTWWKLRDTISDESFIKAIPHRMFSLILSRAYKNASSDYPEFNRRVREELSSLAEYESGHEPSIDGAADKFALMIQAAAPEISPDSVRRPMQELLYHLGRWIYIMDACDDFERDVKTGKYNPLLALYPQESGKFSDAGKLSDACKLSDECVTRLKTTLAHSNNLLSSAFELLPENVWSRIVSNMIYLGMPDACSRVFEGRWPPKSSN